MVNSRARPDTSGIWDRRDEPTWRKPSILIDVCSNIGCSNILNIRDGLSAQQTFFSDLPDFRNFYAHRNQQTEFATMEEASTYSISATLRPSDILRAFPINESLRLLDKWLDEIKFTIQYLCYE